MSNMTQQTELNDEFVRSSGGAKLPSTMKEPAYFYSDNPSDIEDCGYGYKTRNELLKDLYTEKVFDPREQKGVFLQDNFQCRVSRHYFVMPDAALEEMYKPMIDSGELKLLRKKHQHGGLSTTWELESPNTFSIGKDERDKDDVYGIRLILKNSINGGVALSATLRTLRLVCTNGLTTWGMDFSARMAHYGDMDQKLQAFRSHMGRVSQLTEKFTTLMNRTKEIQIGGEMIQYIINKMPYMSKAWVPTWINFEESKKKESRALKVIGLNKEKAPTNLYGAINDFTWLISRADKEHPEHNKVEGELSFLGVTMKEQGLTKAVQQIVKNNGKVPVRA